MKGINRSMVCREVAALAKGVNRGSIKGSICNGHDGGISTVDAIQCKYCKITQSGNRKDVLVFDTEQECINALRTLTEALLDKRFPIFALSSEGTTHLIYPDEIGYQKAGDMPEDSDEIDNIPGTDIPIRSTISRLSSSRRASWSGWSAMTN